MRQPGKFSFDFLPRAFNRSAVLVGVMNCRLDNLPLHAIGTTSAPAMLSPAIRSRSPAGTTRKPSGAPCLLTMYGCTAVAGSQRFHTSSGFIADADFGGGIGAENETAAPLRQPCSLAIWNSVPGPVLPSGVMVRNADSTSRRPRQLLAGAPHWSISSILTPHAMAAPPTLCQPPPATPPATARPASPPPPPPPPPP